MRNWKALVLVATILLQIIVFIRIPQASGSNGSVNLYVICLDGVPQSNFNTPESQNAKYDVRDGAIAAVNFSERTSIPYAHPKSGVTPPFYGITYQVVTDWNTYTDIIQNHNDCIVVNTHGEILPIPTGYPAQDWVRSIAHAVGNRSMTWVHTGGWPFYRVWYQGGSQSSTFPSDGSFGFKNFTECINLHGVDCAPNDQNQPRGMDLTTKDSLSQGWDITDAALAQEGRPLHGSDFQNYTIMPIWGYETQLMPGAVISFATPSQRLMDAKRFGAYVHIGTSQTFKGDGTPTNGNYTRGYIGTATAIITQVQNFRPTAATVRQSDPATDVNCTLGIAPTVAYMNHESRDNIPYCDVTLDFPIYGFMCVSYPGVISLDCLAFSIVPGGENVTVDASASSVLSNSGYDTIQAHGQAAVKAIGKVSFAILSAMATGGASLALRAISGAMLASDVYSMLNEIPPSELNQPWFTHSWPNASFHHSATPLTQDLLGSDNWYYTEFQSNVRLKVEIDIRDSHREQWTVVPLRIGLQLTDLQHRFLYLGQLNTEYDLVVFNDGYSPTTGFKSTCFFDSFDNGLSGWSTADLNHASGDDYWGNFSDAATDFGPCVWCAAVGTNSLYGESPNTIVGFYDRDMNATLTYSIQSWPYKSYWLSYDLFYHNGPGDHLYVEYYRNTYGWSILQDYSGGPANVSLPHTQLVIGTTQIRFRFYSDGGTEGGYIGAVIRHVELKGEMPNDAGSQSDAGDTCAQAVTVGKISSNFGYLTTIDVDCYNFTVTSTDVADEKEVYVSLYGPSGSGFKASLYNRYGTLKAGPSIDLAYSLCPGDQGTWTIKITKIYGFGPYRFDVSVELPGGGCPYVFTWNGSAFVEDNNILPASELGNGTDVKDYYKIEQHLVPVRITQQTSTYCLQIREFEDEKDYIDQVKLISIDHTFDTSIATTSTGDVITYSNPAIPSSCYDNNNVSRLNEIRVMDGNISVSTTYFQGYQDDWLLLNFGRISASNANLVLRDDQKCMDVCINVQVPDGNSDWQTVEVLHPRDFWAMEAVNMSAYIPPNSDFIIRLLWTATHRLDYVGLDTSTQDQIQVHTVSPKLAIHSALGNVTADLLYDDETYVELVNGQRLTLKFALPNQPQGMKRDFILFTNGYYYVMTP